MPELYELIYTSTLADAAQPSCVADIVRTARNYNGLHDVSGVLIFDGANFCQYLEGPDAAVLTLIARIAMDTRHTDFSIKHQGAFQSQRRFATWSMAYALDEDGAVLQKLLGTEGPEISPLLVQSIPYLDMEFGTH
jgi:hypothetical protein